ncbi:MAG: lipoyl synthase [Bacteroidales bacterium]|jgi:lipoic acid synthetase|nr:lipoyl synthase [Bacteroidales bacterium]
MIPGKKPEWLRKKIDYISMREMGNMLRNLKLHTVCEEAKCPNSGECFRNKTATFMILGDVCTRNCKFCAISKGKPTKVDILEPKNIAEAAKSLNLKHVVITSVTRDDLSDGGATHFANCILELRQTLPDSSIEVLIPDLKGNENSLDIIINAKPDIINHNVETIKTLYPQVRALANYQQSLNILKYIKKRNSGIYTKTGIMVGIGETETEVLELFDDLIAVNCDMITIGQYLPPSHNHATLKEYVKPETFNFYKKTALEKGFKFVASGPYVRSSYNAIEGIINIKENIGY